MPRVRRMKSRRPVSSRRSLGLGLIAAGPLILTLLRGLFAAPVFSADAPSGFAPAADETAAPQKTATVVMSDGTEYASARLIARADLTLEVFCAPDNDRKSIAFGEVAELKQIVAEEGREREWRWKEGGANEKLYTGRDYPWRKLNLELRLKSGEKLSGKLGRGVALVMETSTPQGEKQQRQLILQPQHKGEPGATAAPVFVARIAFD